MAMTVSSDFVDHLHPQAVRGRFAFSASGTLGAGGYYVNANLTGDRMADAAKAAKIAAKRAGADNVVLVNISAPTR